MDEEEIQTKVVEVLTRIFGPPPGNVQRDMIVPTVEGLGSALIFAFNLQGTIFLPPRNTIDELVVIVKELLRKQQATASE